MSFALHGGLYGVIGSRVLWVDDHPENNNFERQALEAFGLSFTFVLSTEEALKEISHTHFDAIISDMARPPDQLAGCTLFESLRIQGDKTPFHIS